MFALITAMYERYLGKDGFFRTSDRLIGDAARPSERTPSFSFAEIIAGLSDLREASDASTRVLTDRLTEEAINAQHRSLSGETGPGMPDFTSVLESPLGDAESADYRLVTTPHLGLQRTRR